MKALAEAWVSVGCKNSPWFLVQRKKLKKTKTGQWEIPGAQDELEAARPTEEPHSVQKALSSQSPMPKGLTAASQILNAPRLGFPK